MKKLICVICAICGFITVAQSKVTLPKFFSDNMVLQQQTECRIWGWAEPGKKVMVLTSWDKKGHSVTARKDGQFCVKVKTPEAGGPYTIAFRDGETVMLNNVMIGEVWIRSCRRARTAPSSTPRSSSPPSRPSSSSPSARTSSSAASWCPPRSSLSLQSLTSHL